jgi:hypothetical protein
MASKVTGKVKFTIKGEKLAPMDLDDKKKATNGDVKYYINNKLIIKKN